MTTTPSEDRFAPILKRLALVIALAVGIGVPGGYFSLKYLSLIEHVDITAQVKADTVTSLVTVSPELWIYQPQRMEEVLLRTPPALDDDIAAVRDAAGKLLITVGVTPDAPVLTRSSPIYDSGRVVGQVEITHSSRAVWLGTLVAGLLGLLLGVLVYATLLVLPLRAMRRLNIALGVRERRFQMLFDRATDGIIIVSPEGEFVEINQAFARMHGYSVEEILNLSPPDLLTPETLRRASERFQRAVTGESLFFETEHYHKDGHVIPLEVSTSLLDFGGETLIQAFHRDITARKQAEIALMRQKDLYDMLSQTNQAIVHITSREELFPTVCRIAVEHGRFRFAWIGMIDQNDPRLKPVARYGTDIGYIDQLKNVAVDGESVFGQGLIAQTILSGAHVIHNDFLNDPAVMPWHEAARRAGVRAVAKFAIREGGAVIGAISLYAGDPGFFTEELVATLDEMALDVSFALDNYMREAIHKRAEAALRAAEEQFRGLVEQEIAGIYIIQDGKFAYVNQRFAQIRGYSSAGEIIGRDILQLVAEKDRSAVAEYNRQLYAGDKRDTDFTFTALCKDGSSIEVGMHSTLASHRGRPAIIGLMQDISEKKRADEQIQYYIEQLKTAFMSTVEVATTLSELRDPYTAGHERRVAQIAVAISNELGFDKGRQEGLRVAGHLHDIGKINIPAEILSKPGKLSSIEYQLVQGHSQSGYEVLKTVEFPWPVAQIVLQHHERIDGSGYPQGLKGEAILPEARILAVADVVEAMSSHRPYRPGFGIKTALAEIERGRGTSYDPTAADACLRLFRGKGFVLPD